LGLRECSKSAQKIFSVNFWALWKIAIVFINPNYLNNKVRSVCNGLKYPMLAWPPLTAHCEFVQNNSFKIVRGLKFHCRDNRLKKREFGHDYIWSRRGKGVKKWKNINSVVCDDPLMQWYKFFSLIIDIEHFRTGKCTITKDCSNSYLQKKVEILYSFTFSIQYKLYWVCQSLKLVFLNLIN
jgi:hypothetical protein